MGHNIERAFKTFLVEALVVMMQVFEINVFEKEYHIMMIKYSEF